MESVLVGYTGFVGSNLAAKYNFNQLYNSKNIKNSFRTNPDLCIYAGVKAEKYLANQNPEVDKKNILEAISNIKNINSKKLVLISTIDVFFHPENVDEQTIINSEKLEAYGKNRLFLENWVANNVKDYHVIRLPGLFGKNIKKNFIYDLINVIPSMLTEEKFHELNKKDILISQNYVRQEDGFYKYIKDIKKEILLKNFFKESNFSALNFTDSRGVFQFYNLANLWQHIQLAINHNIKVLHLATEPLRIDEIYKFVTNKNFINELNKPIPYYNYKTINYKLFGGENGYIFNKQNVLNDIKEFVLNESKTT